MEAESSAISFAGTYTPENTRLAGWKSRHGQSTAVFGIVVGTVLVVLPLIAEPPIRGLNAAVIFGCGLAVMFLFLIQPGRRVGKVWRHFRRGIPVSGRLSDSGFEIRSKDSETRSTWSDFQNGRVSGSLILFEDVTGRPYYLPKSFFATDEDWKRASERIAFWAPKRSS
jgi:hypothetical protein